MRTLILILALAQASDPIDFIVGKLLNVTPRLISVISDRGVRSFQINEQTYIWRGGTVDVHQLRRGELLSVRYHSRGKLLPIADSIQANLDRWEGTITRVTGNQIELSSGKTLTVRDGTYYAEGSMEDLEPGKHIEAVGVVREANKMEVTIVIGLAPPQ